jgi:N-acetylmuramoyl-L-alanine amidase
MIDKIVIHCSATPNGREDTAEDIHQWHTAKGWDGIGYHYIVECKGKLVSGRPEYWKGSHAYGHNANSIGICMIGTDRFNIDQWSILENLIRKLKIKYPAAKIMGHNEISKKTCPGFDVQEWLVKIGLK